ncbi:hypothetical protein [Paraconexibacter algicola]|uniref:Uncharacterized protein n=1 Tax=Paraconexibacter algicola TaxID=2133960 RepID=A0A2T4UF98_9ACTN|nr:hypothetical protein [Paraconexibacter algicola]PTL56402.1 hypothetical protein C7Y72_15680 [Paraconexibacter algicola]
MRKSALLATALSVVAVPVAGVAYAATVDQSIDVTVSPSKAGTAKKPAAVKLKVDIKTKKKVASETFATRSAVISFDKNLVFNPSSFATCTQATVQANEAGCAKGSKVGSGTAVGEALGQVANLKVSAFNGPKNTLNLHVTGSAPLAIDSVIVGKLGKASGKYGTKLTVTIPANLQQPLPGVFATLTSFVTTIDKKTSKGKPYVGLKGCSGGKLAFKGDFVFSDGTKASATDSVACKK